MRVTLAARPLVGSLIVPFVVDESRSPVDFKLLDQSRVTLCAEDGRCGVCGGKIRRGPIAFIGPDDGRTCFADAWMHPDCAEVAMALCPFVASRRGWRDQSGATYEVVRGYEGSMALTLASSWRAHRDQTGAWHFEATRPA